MTTEEREAALVEFFYNGKVGSLNLAASLETRLLEVKKVVLVEVCRKLSEDSKFFRKKCSGLSLKITQKANIPSFFGFSPAGTD